MDHFDWKFKRLRLRKTQFALAVETGIPNYVISKFENGRVALTPAQLDRLRAALKKRDGEAA